MHVKTQKITFLGLLLALALILQLLGSYLESSTLFFLAASSFCLGIAIYETGLRLGTGFLIGAIVLSFLLSPNKFYCMTYSAFCLYIYLIELLRRNSFFYRHKAALWIAKLVFYNLCFVTPVLLFFKDFLFVGKASGQITWNLWAYLLFIILAQLALFVFDWAYKKCVPDYWMQLKKRLRLKL